MAIHDPNLDADGMPDGASPKTNRIRFVIVGVVVALSLGYMIYAAFPGNAMYFLTVGEFLDRDTVQDGRVVRVSGRLVEGSFARNGNSTLSHFSLADQDSGAGTRELLASYRGVLPDLFFNPHSEIILQGAYGADRVFQTEEILVKCPSKYQSLEEQAAEQEYGPSG